MTKKCPYCAEEIQAEAIKCRYCGEFLDEEPEKEPTPAERGFRVGRLAVILVVAFLFGSYAISAIRSGGLGRVLAKYLYTASLTLELRAADGGALPAGAAERTVEVLKGRILQLGGREPVLKLEGGSLSITAKGLRDTEKFRELLRRPGVLDLRLVDESEAARKALAEGAKAAAPAGSLLVPGKDGDRFVLSKKDAAAGLKVKSSRVDTNPAGQRNILFQLDEAGAAALLALTEGNKGRRLAVVLDGQVYSAPVITGRISGGLAAISGYFTPDEALELAVVLGSGSLPAGVTVR